MNIDSPERLAMSKDKAENITDQVRDKMAEMAETARSSAEVYMRQAQDFIRKNPTQGLLYALGAGFFVGWLLKR